MPKRMTIAIIVCMLACSGGAALGSGPLADAGTSVKGGDSPENYAASAITGKKEGAYVITDNGTDRLYIILSRRNNAVGPVDKSGSWSSAAGEPDSLAGGRFFVAVEAVK